MPFEGTPGNTDKTPPSPSSPGLTRRLFIATCAVGVGLAVGELLRRRANVEQCDDAVDFESLRDGETLRGKRLRLKASTPEGERTVVVQILERGDELMVRVGEAAYQPNQEIDGKNVTHSQWVKEVSKKGSTVYVNCSIFGRAQVEAEDIARSAMALAASTAQAGDVVSVPVTYRYAPPFCKMGGPQCSDVWMRRLDEEQRFAAASMEE